MTEKIISPQGQVQRLNSGECIDALGRRCKIHVGDVVARWVVAEPITYPAFDPTPPIASHSNEGQPFGDPPPQGGSTQSGKAVTKLPTAT